MSEASKSLSSFCAFVPAFVPVVSPPNRHDEGSGVNSLLEGAEHGK